MAGFLTISPHPGDGTGLRGGAGRAPGPRCFAAARVLMRAFTGPSAPARRASGQGGVRFRIAHSVARPTPPSCPLRAGPRPNAPSPTSSERTRQGSHTPPGAAAIPLIDGGSAVHGRGTDPARASRAGPCPPSATPRAPGRTPAPPPPGLFADSPEPPEDHQVSGAVRAAGPPSRPGARGTRVRFATPAGCLAPPPPPPPRRLGARGRRGEPPPRSLTRVKESPLSSRSKLNRFCTCPQMSRPCPCDSASCPSVPLAHETFAVGMWQKLV